MIYKISIYMGVTKLYVYTTLFIVYFLLIKQFFIFRVMIWFSCILSIFAR